MDNDQNQRPAKSLKPLIAINVALACVLVSILVFLFKGYETTYPPASSIPAFGMANAFDDGTFDSGDLQDDIYVLNIFASWCEPCEAEHKPLSKMAEKYNVPIYGIAYQDTEDNIHQFLEENGNPYKEIGMDKAGLMLKALGLQGLPVTIVADKNLKIHMIWQGPVTSKVVREKIMPLVDSLRTIENT